MTQELIANMLGVRREGVTEGARKLQKAGLIRYSRGHITVLDRGGLEARTCECYAVVKKEYDRLLPDATAQQRRRTGEGCAACYVRWQTVRRGAARGHSAFDAGTLPWPSPANHLIERLPRRDRARLLARCDVRSNWFSLRCCASRASRCAMSTFRPKAFISLLTVIERHAPGSRSAWSDAKACSGRTSSSACATAPLRALVQGAGSASAHRMARTVAPSWRAARRCSASWAATSTC